MILPSMMLMAVAASSDPAIQQQAARCGLKPDQLVWTMDAGGERGAQIKSGGDSDSLSFTSLMCMLDWAKKTGARIGFISEPPPPPKPNHNEIARIESECGLKKGTITVAGDQIWLLPSPDEAYEHIDCAIARLNKAGLGKLGFVGNEADPNAVLQPPLRYTAEGGGAQIAALMKAAEADKWVINKTATASDGTAIVQFESGAMMTHGQASRLLDRIWNKEFGDIAFGMAPRKLSDPNPFDD